MKPHKSFVKAEKRFPGIWLNRKQGSFHFTDYNGFRTGCNFSMSSRRYLTQRHKGHKEKHIKVCVRASVSGFRVSPGFFPNPIIPRVLKFHFSTPAKKSGFVRKNMLQTLTISGTSVSLLTFDYLLLRIP